MKEVTIIGVDLAENVFQLHGAAADGAVMYRRKLSRPQFHRFMTEHPRCVVAMEACGGAHHWARGMEQADYEVKRIAPRYVKPFIKRQKAIPQPGKCLRHINQWLRGREGSTAVASPAPIFPSL